MINIPVAFQGLFKPYRYKVYYGGRGSAKSRSIGAALIRASMAGHERILCGREIQRSINDSVKRLLDDEIERLGVQSYFHSTKTELICKRTDSPFMFAGLRTNIDSIKSIEGITKFWGEEAHGFSQESLDIIIPTIRAGGSELWFSYNPKMKKDPIHNMFVVNSPPPGSLVRKVGYRDNPFFPEVLQQEMEWDRENNPDKYAHVWEGNPVVHSDAQVFYGAWCVEPVPEPNDDQHFYYGADFGFSKDPTTINRMWIKEDTLYIDYEARGLRTEIDKTPELFDKVPGARDHFITADCARPETISFLNRNGFRVRPSKKGAGSIEDGIEHLRKYKIVIDPRCKHTIDEFNLYSYKTDRLTGEITSKIEDANNHHIDGIRYGLEPVMRHLGDLRIRQL